MLVVSLCLPCDELAACAGSRNSPQVMEIGPSGLECRKSDFFVDFIVEGSAHLKKEKKKKAVFLSKFVGTLLYDYKSYTVSQTIYFFI